MIAANEDALVCDLAETYGILDYRALPVSLLATLCVGLRDESRIKMHLCGAKATQNTLLMAAAVDRLSFLAWTKTKNAQNGIHQPQSILSAVLGTQTEREIETFDTAEDFIAARTHILGVKKDGD
ncbi:MAG: DUF5361 domain-containing protein [Ruthenibacterium sp.]